MNEHDTRRRRSRGGQRSGAPNPAEDKLFSRLGALRERQDDLARRSAGLSQELAGLLPDSSLVPVRFKQFRNRVFALFPEIERKILHKKVNLEFKGQQGREASLPLKLLAEDKDQFRALLQELNDLLISLDESSNYAVIEHVHETLFDIGRNIERKLKLFRQLASKRELQKMFKQDT